MTCSLVIRNIFIINSHVLARSHVSWLVLGGWMKPTSQFISSSSLIDWLRVVFHVRLNIQLCCLLLLLVVLVIAVVRDLLVRIIQLV